MTARKITAGCRRCHQKVDTRKLGYVQFFDECERRAKKGQKQTQCPYCGLWCWPDELPKDVERMQQEAR